MRPPLKVRILAADRFGMFSAPANEYLRNNAIETVRRINLVRGIKNKQQLINAINGILYIYYFNYHTMPEQFEGDAGEIGDTVVRENVAIVSDNIIRAVARTFKISPNQLMNWDTFYRNQY